MNPPPKDLLLFKRCLNALDAEAEAAGGWQQPAEKCSAWYALRAELRERLKDNESPTKSWRKETPDVPGMWLAAFWKDGRWWTDILHVIQHGTPKRADATWWYLGPIELPNDMSNHCEDCSPEFTECWHDIGRCRKRQRPPLDDPSVSRTDMFGTRRNKLCELITLWAVKQQQAAQYEESINALSDKRLDDATALKVAEDIVKANIGP